MVKNTKQWRHELQIETRTGKKCASVKRIETPPAEHQPNRNTSTIVHESKIPKTAD